MKQQYTRLKHLFLKQSYLDTWEDYVRSIRKRSFIKWDYVILTASNEDQAKAYRIQIQYRLERNLLPKETFYRVIPDPGGKRVGSGGATFNVLRCIAQEVHGTPNENPFSGKRILVIHSGGDSKRVPQYSACGKLFAPVPRELPNGETSALFDELIIGMSGIPGRISEGMLVLSGDVLLLFNPLQIDFQFHGAAAISMKEDVKTGKDHGVFLNDGREHVQLFLHKQTEEQLRALGAVNEHGKVDLDTGAVIMDAQLLYALYGLVCTDGRLDEEKFGAFVNETARVSFYGDFLYPLAKGSTLKQYYQEAAEGSLCPELSECRRRIWEALKGFSLKLLCVSPSEFIHFGTSRELSALMTKGVDDYVFLEWSRFVMTNVRAPENRTDYSVSEKSALHTSFVDKGAVVGAYSYIEFSHIGAGTAVGQNCIVSSVDLEGVSVPENTVLHGLRLNDGRFVVRIFGICDNAKSRHGERSGFLGTSIEAFMEKYGIFREELWENGGSDLWSAKLFPVEDTMKQAVGSALELWRMAHEKGTDQKLFSRWKGKERVSLCESFRLADVQELILRKRRLEREILAERFLDALCRRIGVWDALRIFGDRGIDDTVYQTLIRRAEKAPFGERIRIYYYLSRYMKEKKIDLCGCHYDVPEGKCFREIRQVVAEGSRPSLSVLSKGRIVKDEVHVRLPVRVNWGGGWTDTPPYCNEHGGVVLNAAISLRGTLPIHVQVRRLSEPELWFESIDTGAREKVDSLKDVQNCCNPYDCFALHKAALLSCGVVQREGEGEVAGLLKAVGGGILLSTQVEGVPKGSGLGTSSILSAACVKALHEFFGAEISDRSLYSTVLYMEQLMSTGGGWQDQAGGLYGGIKMISTKPGISQDIIVRQVELSETVKEELQERFALIYTGQRRLARNLLRDVIGGYIGGRKESAEALDAMQRTAALMEFELKRGNVDGFAKLLSQHWELSRMLDAGTSNSCIDHIFLICEDLIDGKFIAGAGGGGFLQVILKKGVSKEMLSSRLRAVFQESGVDVWESAFIDHTGETGWKRKNC